MSNIEVRRNNGHLSPLEWGFMTPLWNRLENALNLGLESGTFHLACDIDEREKEYVVTFDAPGLKREDINVEVSGDTLTVSGEKKSEVKREGKGEYYQERRYGRFQRSLTLPKGAKADSLVASYEDGVLTLTIPKAVAAEGARKIPITTKSEEKSSEKKQATH